MSTHNRRIELDVMKLLMSDFDTALVNDNMREFCVCLPGPEDTPYEGGLWKLHVELPEQYPYKSPSIGFETKIFHPNIDETSGSVCLDVINQTWSPMFTLIHVFETFIPQLLNYPNAADPLNGDASSLYINNRELYNEKVKTYVQKYANKEQVLGKFRADNGIESDIEDADDDYMEPIADEYDKDAEKAAEPKIAVENSDDDDDVDMDEDDDDDDDDNSFGMDL